MKGLRHKAGANITVMMVLEISPVYEGIKTIFNAGANHRKKLEISPVYEGIKTTAGHWGTPGASVRN